jgi:hypothetical protein
MPACAGLTLAFPSHPPVLARGSASTVRLFGDVGVYEPEVFLQCDAMDDPDMHEVVAARVRHTEIFLLADHEIWRLAVGAGRLAFVVGRRDQFPELRQHRFRALLAGPRDGDGLFLGVADDDPIAELADPQRRGRFGLRRFYPREKQGRSHHPRPYATRLDCSRQILSHHVHHW